MNLRCKIFGHKWEDWSELTYEEYLAKYPRLNCKRCSATKNVQNE